jgi:hypothetical protein
VVISVACLTRPAQWRYRVLADAMAEGIRKCGDRPQVSVSPVPADVAFSYGWKHHRDLEAYPRFIYADLGYWQRDRYYRLAVGAWGPERYVCAGLPRERFAALGLRVQPWTKGTEIIVAGSSEKAAADHGLSYMQWERAAVKRLQAMGLRAVYRPKPKDPRARPIPGAAFDQRPISEALAAAAGWVTHHSNSAVDALLAGVPVHCEIGAAAALSVPLEQIGSRPRPEGREQFLADVAWLQWTVEEMRSGEAWAHLKERGLMC